MTDEELRALAQRLIVRRKADGRGVYDEVAKAELVAEGRRPGRSISRLARECGVNANQLNRWIREDREQRGGGHSAAIRAAMLPSPFVPVTIEAPASSPPASVVSSMSIQARLPNGVVVELRDGNAAQLNAVIAALGGLPCFVSTSA